MYIVIDWFFSSSLVLGSDLGLLDLIDQSTLLRIPETNHFFFFFPFLSLSLLFLPISSQRCLLECVQGIGHHNWTESSRQGCTKIRIELVTGNYFFPLFLSFRIWNFFFFFLGGGGGGGMRRRTRRSYRQLSCIHGSRALSLSTLMRGWVRGLCFSAAILDYFSRRHRIIFKSFRQVSLIFDRQP